jgi:hypothetical protein
MDQRGINHLEGPPSSPNLLIIETWVQPLRRAFTKELCTTVKEDIQRFYRVFDELKSTKIDKTINSYLGRLHDVLENTEGQATNY